ncbi:porin [Escherichia coli]|uniref:porin OmpF n=1 Tax=Escherichia coli TaxID=562 RepID=UPI00069C27A5|nr:porin OmpF [Escherichia coli]KNZ05591.1 porin [Escherichia coli]
MMKRNILAVIVPALLVAGTANAAEIYNKDGNKVDLYGKAVGLHYFSKGNGENSYGGNGDMTYARLGFKGETQINSDLTGYGQWEYNFQGNYGVVYDALGYTDMLPEFGGDTAYSDDFFVGRVGGVATYRNSNFFGLVDGLNFAVQYLGKNERDTARRSNGDGVGGSISYEYEGFGIVGAYGAADRTNLQEAQPLGNGKKAEQWATGLKYDANNIYLAANYGETRNATPITNKFTNTSGFANKTQDVLLVAQYQFDFGLRPSIAYTKSKAKDVEGIGDVDLVNYFEVGATYYFNKNMSTYVDYIINQIDSDNKLGVGSDDTVAVGIVYQF